MYTIQSPSYITIVMDAAFYLCAIRATILFSLVIEQLIGLHVRGYLFSRRMGEQKRIVYKKIRMKQYATNVYWLSQYRKSNPPIKIIKSSSQISQQILAPPQRSFCSKGGLLLQILPVASTSLCPEALTAIDLVRTKRSNQGDYQSVL